MFRTQGPPLLIPCGINCFPDATGATNTLAPDRKRFTCNAPFQLPEPTLRLAEPLVSLPFRCDHSASAAGATTCLLLPGRSLHSRQLLPHVSTSAESATAPLSPTEPPCGFLRQGDSSACRSSRCPAGYAAAQCTPTRRLVRLCGLALRHRFLDAPLPPLSQTEAPLYFCCCSHHSVLAPRANTPYC